MGLPLFVAKLIGRGIANKLNLQEGPLETGKSWYRSKGIWTGIVTVLVGTYEASRVALAPQFGWNLPEIPSYVFAILGGIGVYSRAVATGAITK